MSKTVYGEYTLKQQIDFEVLAEFDANARHFYVDFTATNYSGSTEYFDAIGYVRTPSNGWTDIYFKVAGKRQLYLVSSVRFSRNTSEEGILEGSSWELKAGSPPNAFTFPVLIPYTSKLAPQPNPAYYSTIKFALNGATVPDDCYDFLLALLDFKNEKPPYTISFYQEEGVKYSPLQSDLAVPKLPIPFKNDYVFKYWYDYFSGVLEEVVEEGDLLTSNMLLKAKFEEAYPTEAVTSAIMPYSEYFGTWLCSPRSWSILIDRLSNPYKTEWARLGFYSDGEIVKQIICSVKVFPFHASDIRETKDFNILTDCTMIYPVGNNVKIVEGFAKIDPASEFNFAIARLKVDRYYNDFRDYEPYTNYSLYLPYFGIVDIPTNILYGHDYSVVACVDMVSGMCNYSLVDVQTEEGDSSVGFRYGEWKCNLGISIPYTAFGRKDQFDVIESVLGVANSVSNGVDVGAKVGGSAGGVLGAAIAVAGAYTAAHSLMSRSVYGASGDDFSKVNMPRKAFLIRELKKDIDNKYDDFMGKPLCQTRYLHTLHGFTKISDIHLDNIPCTEDEKSKLYSILTTGVILP